MIDRIQIKLVVVLSLAELFQFCHELVIAHAERIQFFAICLLPPPDEAGPLELQLLQRSRRRYIQVRVHIKYTKDDRRASGNSFTSAATIPNKSIEKSTRDVCKYFMSAYWEVIWETWWASATIGALTCQLQQVFEVSDCVGIER